jgi:hypothetical protein
MILKILAQVGKDARSALGFSGCTDVSSVEDEQMMRGGDEVRGNEFDEPFFDGGGSFAVGQSDASADAKNVGIHREGGHAVKYGKQDVGGFSSHAGQGLEFGAGGGQLPPVFFDDDFRHTRQVFGFVVGVGHAFDDLVNFRRRGPREGVEIRKAFKKGGGYPIDPFVGALGGKNDGYRQLIGVAVVQLGLGMGKNAAEPFDDDRRFFMRRHLSSMPITNKSSV